MTPAESALGMFSISGKNNQIVDVLTSIAGNRVLTLTPALPRPVLLSIISELLKIIMFQAGSELLTSPLTNFCFTAHGSQNF